MDTRSRQGHNKDTRKIEQGHEMDTTTTRHYHNKDKKQKSHDTTTSHNTYTVQTGYGHYTDITNKTKTQQRHFIDMADTQNRHTRVITQNTHNMD